MQLALVHQLLCFTNHHAIALCQTTLDNGKTVEKKEEIFLHMNKNTQDKE